MDLPPHRRPRRSIGCFRRLQLVSAAAFSLIHGANDAQKTMGIIAGVLFTGGLPAQTFTIPFWVVLAAHAAIGLGTLSGGWRIIHTMGSKITKLTPVGGFAAETGAAVAIFIATHLGVGISTTHTDHRRHRRRRRHAAAVRGPLGRGAADRLGLGAHDSGGRAGRGRHLRDPRAARRALIASAIRPAAVHVFEVSP